MNKCFKCGAEFEGKFCPECGAKHQETKICPQCGNELDGSVKFCNECGYNCVRQTSQLETETSQVSQPTKISYEFSPKFYQKVNKVLTLLPAISFILFAVFNWIFMACDIASLSISWGNVYTMVNDYDFHSSAIALIVFAALSCLVSVFYFFVVSLRKDNKVTIIAQISAYVMCFCVFVTACALNAAVSKDGLQVESATKLLIAFSIIFVAFSVGAIIANKLLLQRSDKYAQAIQTQEVQPTFMQKVAHHTSNYYKSHTKSVKRVFGLAVVVTIVLVLVLGVIVPVTTSEFNTNRLAKINIGDSKESVDKLFGVADEQTDYLWTYYGKYWKNFKNKEREADEWTDNIEDFGHLFKSFDVSEKLEQKESQIVDKLLQIFFDRDGNVAGVEFNKQHAKNSNTNIEKQTKSIALIPNKIPYGTTPQETELYAKIFYTDGSYQLNCVNGINAEEINIGWKLSWSDNWGEYSITILESKDPSNVIENANNYYIIDLGQDRYRLLITGNVTNSNRGYDWDSYGERITSIYVSKNVTSIPHNAFDQCTKVAFTQSNNAIYLGTASNPYQSLWKATDTDITSCTISSSTVTIMNGAFSNCNSLQTVTFEGTSQLTSIGSYAFSYCSNLTSITIPSKVTSIDISTFSGCSSLTSITISDIVTSIGGEAFKDCSSLQTVTFEGDSKLTFIDDSAFFGCSRLTSITVPENVTSIGKYAFRDCSNLKTVRFEGNSQLTYIGYSSFYNCINLQTVTFDGNSQLTSIDNSAFRNCSSLTSIIMPATITSIGNYAFYDCSSLKRVFYGETAEQWNKITIGGSNTDLTNATRYYYSEKNPFTNGVTSGNYWHWVDGKPTIWTKED